ncbi:uncharacterized protein V1518DRAFT_421681 [Limtongia smithiae]|uniref:uncharacterized protein n=1 Tax=Limtongia smithiae TaxID=1125753 RepID=UPI0034CD6033
MTATASASSTASSTSSSAAATSCAANDTSAVCQRPVGTQSLAIGLGVAIPVAICIVLLIFFHRRYVRRVRREDLAAQAIDITQDDFDPSLLTGGKMPLSDMDATEKRANNKQYSPYLMHGPFDESRISLSGPYDVVPKEISRISHQQQLSGGYGAYPPFGAAREYTRRANASHDLLSHPRSRMAPKVPSPLADRDSYEMHTVSKPSTAMVYDRADSLRRPHMFTHSNLSSSSSVSSLGPVQKGPWVSSTPPSNVLLASTSPFSSSPVSDDSKDATYSPSDATDIVTVPAPKLSLASNVDSTCSSDYSNYQDAREPVELTPEMRPAPEAVPAADPVTVPAATAAQDFSRAKSLSRPEDAEARTQEHQTFYQDYFEESNIPPPLPRSLPETPPVSHQEGPRISGPHQQARPSPPLHVTPYGGAPSARSNMPYRPAPPMPRSGSSQSVPIYLPPSTPTSMNASLPTRLPPPQRRENRTPLPPLQPLPQLPTPHNLSEDEILASPTSFAPPRRHANSIASSNASSVGGDQPPAADQLGGMDLRSLPSPSMLRNSHMFSPMEFLPSKNLMPQQMSPATRAARNGDISALDHHNQALTHGHVPMGKTGIQGELKPSWGMRE